MFNGPNEIYVSPDRATKFVYDSGSSRLNVYVNDALVGYWTANGYVQVVDDGAAVAVGGAVTLNKPAGKITSEALTTAQNGIYTLTVTNSEVAAGDLVMASVANGDNSQGTPMIGKVTPAGGSFVIEVINKHATSVAFNGTVVVSFVVFKTSS